MKKYYFLVGAVALAVFLVTVSLFGGRNTKFDNAVAAFEAKDFEQSIALFTDIIDSGDLGDENLAQAYAYRGYAQYFRGHNEAAIEDYSIALDLNPENRELRHTLVAALAAIGDYAKALAEADRAVEQDPSDSIAYGNRCDIRRILEQFEAALKDCNHAVALAPEFAYSWMERAKLHRDWGRHEKARNDAEAAYELWPEHPAIKALAQDYGLTTD